MAETSDRSLLRAYHRGSQSAARSLYLQTAPRLIAYAQSILRDQALAEDVVQSVFCKILTLGGREVRQVKNPECWMVCLVRNEAITILRSSVRRSDREAMGHVGPSNDITTNSADDSVEGIRCAVERLDDQRREIITLKCALGLTFEQIAQTLEINRNTAASRYREAIAQLREHFKVRAPEESAQEVNHHA